MRKKKLNDKKKSVNFIQTPSFPLKKTSVCWKLSTFTKEKKITKIIETNMYLHCQAVLRIVKQTTTTNQAKKNYLYFKDRREIIGKIQRWCRPYLKEY